MEQRSLGHGCILRRGFSSIQFIFLDCPRCSSIFCDFHILVLSFLTFVCKKHGNNKNHGLGSPLEALGPRRRRLEGVVRVGDRSGALLAGRVQSEEDRGLVLCIL